MSSKNANKVTETTNTETSARAFVTPTTDTPTTERAAHEARNTRIGAALDYVTPVESAEDRARRESFEALIFGKVLKSSEARAVSAADRAADRLRERNRMLGVETTDEALAVARREAFAKHDTSHARKVSARSAGVLGLRTLEGLETGRIVKVK